MAIQTVVITGVLSAPDASFLSGYFVRFRLSNYDATDNGVISSTKTYTLPIETDGSIAGDIWPNAAGEGGTFYQVHILDDRSREVEFLGKLQIGTDGPYDLADLIRSQSPTPNPSFIRVITQAEYDAILQSATDADAARAAAAVQAANSAQSATVATAAAEALLGSGGAFIPGDEILKLVSKLVPAVETARGVFDTGARLLSGASERAVLRYGEDNDTLNFMLGFPTTDGFRFDFTVDSTVFSDTAGTTPADPGDSLARVNDVSGNGLNSTQANAALRGKKGKAPKVVRNLLVNTATLSTQSRTVTAVSHTLSFKGTGTVTLSGASTAGPLVGTGASDRVSLTFTPSAGTLTLTVSGAVTEGQLEIGALSDYQAVGASNLDVTESGVESFGFLRPDQSDDVLPLTVPAIDGDILIAGKKGTWIEPAAPSAGAFSLGPTTYTGGTPGILRAVGDITGVELIDKTLSAEERARVIAYYTARGAKGLLVPGGDPLNSLTDYTTEWIQTEDGWTINAASLACDGVDASEFVYTGGITNLFGVLPNTPIAVSLTVSSYVSGVLKIDLGTGSTNTIKTVSSDGEYDAEGVLTENGRVYLKSENFQGTVSEIEIRLIRPEEDW